MKFCLDVVFGMIPPCASLYALLTTGIIVGVSSPFFYPFDFAA